MVTRRAAGQSAVRWLIGQMAETGFSDIGGTARLEYDLWLYNIFK